LPRKRVRRQEVRKLQRAASTLVKKIGAFVNGASEPFRVEGRFLATAQGTIYVLAENTMGYFIYDNSVKQLAASKFRRRGYRVIEVIQVIPKGLHAFPI
jgi:hypothetical protein